MFTIKKYRVSVKSDSDNIFHPHIDGSEAVPVEFEVGKPGFFVYKFEEDTDEVASRYHDTPWHRVVTSNVKDIREENEVICTYPAIPVHKIIVETENSTYCFKEI